MSLTPELASLKDEALAISPASWARSQGWKLRQVGAELIGPCPKCGGDDRFSINSVSNAWNCRWCLVGGYDVIFLVEHVEDLKFVAALERITGRRAAEPVNAERAAELRRNAELDQARRTSETERYRKAAQEEAWTVWSKTVEPGPDVVAYFETRKIVKALKLIDANRIRFLSDHPYELKSKIYHRGPAIICKMQRTDNRFGGVHQTWLDRAQEKGKALVLDADGKELAPKMTRGSKHGSAIRLRTPWDGEKITARRLVLGEGLETTASVLVDENDPDTAYWCAIDIGNMSGKAPWGAGGKRAHNQPDMADEKCFQVPDWVEELVLLGDDGRQNQKTNDAMQRAAKRAMRLRPGLLAKIAWAGDGLDFNDLKMQEAGN